MWSKPSRRLSRAFPVAVLSLALAVLAGCQARPLYTSDTQATPVVASVGFSEATSRVGQKLRNHLIFLTSGGAGEPASPAYEVDLTVSSATSGVLLIDSSDTARAGQVKVTGQYSIRKAGEGTILKSGTRSATALVDFSVQQFAKERAIQDAEDRAAREAAEMIRADLQLVMAH